MTSGLLSSKSSGSWWAASVDTYCPGTLAEHSKSKSSGDSYHPDVSPCMGHHIVSPFFRRHNRRGRRIEQAAAPLRPVGRLVGARAIAKLSDKAEHFTIFQTAITVIVA